MIARVKVRAKARVRRRRENHELTKMRITSSLKRKSSGKVPDISSPKS